MFSYFLYSWCSVICGLADWGEAAPPSVSQSLEIAKDFHIYTSQFGAQTRNHLLYLALTFQEARSLLPGPGTGQLKMTPRDQSLPALFKLANLKLFLLLSHQKAQWSPWAMLSPCPFCLLTKSGAPQHDPECMACPLLLGHVSINDKILLSMP